ncbi:MAG: arginine biosynthesis protein ArgJ, partial [Planctomycetota bacterium]
MAHVQNIDLPTGFRFAGVACGIKASAGKRDLSLIVADRDVVATGVYTQNAVVAAPVILCRQRTPTDRARAIVINSGNANACTGKRGEADANRMASCVAETLAVGTQADQVLVMSTGVIGRYLPME